jgi:predicted Zn-dependent protease
MHFEPRARRLQDLSIEQIVKQYAGYARDRIKAGLPKSGRYPVVLSGDALTGIFGPLIHQTSGANIYRGTSRFRLGESLFSPDDVVGEPLTVVSNGFVPFGLRTFPADSDGIPSSRFVLVRNGLFENAWTTKRYADYLKTEPTGNIANLEIPVGPISMNSLLTDDQPILHVVAFSALLPDMVSGNFAAEIKLGYHIEGDTIRPVTGGSLSGNLISCFANTHFSTESVFSHYALSLDSFGSYIGPQAIRFGTFQTSGD